MTMAGPTLTLLWLVDSLASRPTVLQWSKTSIEMLFIYISIAGAIAISAGLDFLETSSRNIELIQPNCHGNESMLGECSRTNSITCTSLQAVGVDCQGRYKLM